VNDFLKMAYEAGAQMAFKEASRGPTDIHKKWVADLLEGIPGQWRSARWLKSNPDPEAILDQFKRSAGLYGVDLAQFPDAEASVRKLLVD
jgi:hypothetical protein